ncbi:uncharacterized protein LOC143368937 [Andrena cerasifolii]|uniref:uncharacterized protein LOC143368937 n=1 Tax=Andrena cerasifolii TaxID=2819439 RepID=UPI0040378C7E
MEKQQPSISYTGRQCSAKLRSLKRTYKGVKDHNAKSGNDRQDWAFYKTMDEMLEKKSLVCPGSDRIVHRFGDC